MKLDATEQMLNLVDEDGKLSRPGIRRFEENWKLIESDTQPRCLEKLKPQIDAIKAMFLAGDREGLVQQLARTAPDETPRAHARGFSLIQAALGLHLLLPAFECTSV